MKRIVLAAAVVLSLTASAAQAGPLFYTTPTPGNNVIPKVEGWLGANLYLVAGAATTIQVDFLGKEAGWTNRFFLNDTLVVSSSSYGDANGATITPITSFSVSPGLISFKFTTNQGTGNLNAGVVTNGSNVLPDEYKTLTTPNFFVSLGNGAGFLGDTALDGVTATSGQVAVIAFDDAGAGSDDNHDDLVIRLTVTNGSFSTPDGGATFALLGSALMGLGILRRKFQA